jgi:cytidylate kinase
MIITISGLPCTGTTTLANELGKKYNLKVINAGKIFREMAKENGMDVIEFGRYMAEHPELDKQIDKRMVEYAYTEDNIILEGRLIKWYLLKETIPTNLSIWLKAPMYIKTKRMVKREKMSYDEAFHKIAIRESGEYKRYMDNFDIDITDLSIYDLVIDTNRFSVDDIIKIVIL